MLSVGDVLTNDELRAEFKVSGQGGMRYSSATNTLVLVSTRGSLYRDRWVKGVLHYTGEGQTGDQSLSGQNRRLHECDKSTTQFLLFEKFVANEYVYQGPVGLDSAPYQQEQSDSHGHDRLVWMFPLRLLSDQSYSPPLHLLHDEYLKTEKLATKALKKSPVELAKLALTVDQHVRDKPPANRKAIVQQPQRSGYISQWTMFVAGGICQLCSSDAPFVRSNGQPYLECHHVTWMAKGGKDTVDNTVALCPNCHRKMHIVKGKKDEGLLRQIARENFEKLKVQLNK